MGLNMYLYGHKYHWKTDADKERKEDGFPVRGLELELGDWCRHPNLHGYITATFAEDGLGEDEWRDIELTANDLRRILIAVSEQRLPHTEGFFFGKSDGSERKRDMKILKRAIVWLEGGDIPAATLEPPEPIGGGMTITRMIVNVDEACSLQRVSRTIVYHASW